MTAELSHAAYRNMVETCRAHATQNAYIKHLRLFLKYLRLQQDDYDKLLD